MEADELIAQIAKVIDGVFEHPSLHVGGIGQPHAADQIHTLLYHFISLWAIAHDRGSEFNRVVYSVSQETGSGPVAKFQAQNPNGTPEECSRYVLQHWRGIAEQMDFPLSSKSGS